MAIYNIQKCHKLRPIIFVVSIVGKIINLTNKIYIDIFKKKETRSFIYLRIVVHCDNRCPVS